MDVVRHETVGKICKAKLFLSTQKMLFDERDALAIDEARTAIVRAER